ncbi:hypothetical protein BgiMline_036436, partial [Biomphalaria glabrata]
STYIQLQYLGLDKYMRDPTLTKNLECIFSASAAAGSKPPSSGTWITNPNSNTNNNNYVVPCGEDLL